MRAYLDGVLLEQGPSTGWSLQAGTAPHVRVLEIDEARATVLFEGAKIHGSTLVLDATDEGGKRREFKRLTILGTSPTLTRGTVGLTLADPRWEWPYKLYPRSYNVLRRTGRRRKLPGQDEPAIAERAIQDDVFFHAWSLRDEEFVWLGEETLKDALTLLSSGNWKLGPRTKLEGLVQPQDLEPIGMRWDSALGFLLGYFGLAFQVYYNDEGQLVVYDRLSNGERELVGLPVPEPGAANPGGTVTTATAAQPTQGAGGLLVGEQLWAVQDRRWERPSAIEIYTVRAMEVRADAVERADGSHDTGLDGTSTERGERQALPIRMDQVVALPEDATISGERLVLGTYARYKAYVDYLRTLPSPGSLPLISIPIIRDGYLSPVLQAYGEPSADPTGLWAIRASVLHADYRIRYRLEKVYLDRLRSLRPYRVSVLDPETAGRGPAQVFTDWCRWVPWRWNAGQLVGASDAAQGVIQNVYANEASGPGSIVGTPLKDLRPAPAEVRIADEDQGIFELGFLISSRREHQAVLQSALTDDSLPSHNPEARNRWLQWGKLTQTHEVSIIFTASPAAPNDLRQFHKVTITPAELGISAPAKGPVMQVLVSPGRSVARFAWRDDRADQVYEAFAARKSVDMTDALGEPVNSVEVNEVAKAVARATYAGFADHVEGGLGVPFNPDVQIQGTIAQIDHEISARDGAITRIALPSEPPTEDWVAQLPSSVRKFVRREVT